MGFLRIYATCLARSEQQILEELKKTKMMVSSSITLWQIEGEKVEAVTDFISWAPKSLRTLTAALKLKETFSLKGKLRQT